MSNGHGDWIEGRDGPVWVRIDDETRAKLRDIDRRVREQQKQDEMELGCAIIMIVAIALALFVPWIIWELLT